MGLFSSSKSSSSSTYATENHDKRIALDNQSQGISGDANSISVTTNMTTTDSGAIINSIGLSRDVAKQTNESLKAAISAASAATRDALAANTSVVKDALQVSASVNRDSLAFASTVNKDALTLAERGQTLIANSAAESLGMVGHVVDKAFSLTDKNTMAAIEASVKASNLVGRAYETATGYQAEKQTADSKYMVVAGLVAVALIAIKVFGK